MNNEVADETLRQIGVAIARDPELYDDWTHLEVIFKVREGSLGHSAAQFVADGERIGFLLSSNNEALELMHRLQAATVNVDGTSWVACTIDLIRATKELRIEFDYLDEKSWDQSLPF